MTGRYKAYSEYKDSGIDWVGDVPSSWFVKPTFSVFDPQVTKNTEGQETKVLSLSYGNIVERDVETNFGLLPESFNTYQIVDDGDLILRLTDLQNDKKSLRVGMVKQRGIITSAYLKLRASNSIEPRFAYRLLHSYDTTKVFYGMGGGLRQSMKFEDFRRLPILVPSLDEQQKIANFLDHETAKIDTLITKQEKLIELLKEKRQAVISHAVTKGLNPDAPMKNSGVEWLGEVPEHWDVSQLKHHVNTVNGFGFSSNDFQDEGVPFIRAGNIKNKTIVKPDIHLPQSVVDKYQRVIMNAGELVISMVGSDPKIKASAVGQVGLVPLSLAGSVPNQNVVILREKSSLIKQFLFYVVCGTPYRYHLDVFSHKLANQSIISSSLIINAHFAFPTLEEQMQVVDFLDTQLQKYDALVEKAISSIELMKERKTALISAAVTGKIDVRDWKPAENNLVEVA